MRLAIATHAMLLTVDVDSNFEVVDSRVLDLGYHYGLALGPAGSLIAYRGGESVHRQDDLRLMTFRGGALVPDSEPRRLTQPMGAVHQVVAANGGLYIANTLFNSVTFLADGRDRQDFQVDGAHSDENHVNSVFPAGRDLLVMLHNLFRRESQILVLNHDPDGTLVPRHRLSLWHRQCHNVFADAAQLAYNASADRTFVVADLENDRMAAAISFEQHSKGLAVTDHHFIVGLSEYTSRDERSSSNGWLQVIDRRTFQLVQRIDLAALDLPIPVGNINDIRIMSGEELGHASDQPLDVDWSKLRLARSNPAQYLAARARTTLEYPLRTAKKRIRARPDRPMRVGIHVVQNDGRGTGMSTYTTGLIDALRRFGQGAEYVIFAHEASIDLWRDVTGGEMEVISVPHPGLRPGSGRALMRRGLYDAGFDAASRELNRKYESLAIDVAHYTGDRLTPLAVRVPAVISFFSANYWTLPAERFWDSHTQHRLSLVQLKMSLRRARAVVAPSTFVRNALVQFGGLPPEKIFVSRLAGWVKPIENEPTVDIGGLGVPDRYVLYPSNSWPYKNHARLFEAMALVNARCEEALGLVLTGSEDPALLDQARAAGVAEHTRLLGFVSRAELATLYRNAVATVHPSLYEAGGSFSMAESMYSGAPVICSRLGPMMELAGPAARYFDPYAPVEIAEAICDVATNPSVRSELIQRGHDRTTTFSTKEAIQTLMAAYRHAAETGPTG